MTRRWLTALLTALLGALLLVPSPAAATVTARAEVDFRATVALSNCSGSVVRLAGAAADDPALVLSNGHCLQAGFPEPGEVIIDRPSQRQFRLLTADGRGELGTLRASRLVYATMTETDVSLYRLRRSYAELEQAYGVRPLRLASATADEGTAISVVSGYWKRIYSCTVDGFVHELREAGWTWRDSIRYTPSCDTIGGTSGSPIIDRDSGEVVGVNNTGNEDGQRCTLNNPCEVDEHGNVTVRHGTNYGQQTYRFYGCLIAGSRIDLTRPDCHLPS
ncbi:S1 family peptidase [Amycolatopsis cihanbeyliensis]|uniref:Trypsin-like peptidase n=1 Tax=Amycolatopsis cihanbeyliensis TaxID=1128664 RepID=A0A542DN09_AMYCI|nr:serine protease [Amycolatopsis cihanbeyliensis]TQJ04479.1 trypsin-like peptidase [Amycolatopsis cihanbeyliensis]